MFSSLCPVIFIIWDHRQRLHCVPSLTPALGGALASDLEKIVYAGWSGTELSSIWSLWRSRE